MGTNINFNKILGISKETNIVLPTSSTGDTESMIFTITTVSAGQTFRLSGTPSTANVYNYDVDWGDGSSDTGVTLHDKTHVYALPGLYEIKITGSIYLRNFNTTYSEMYTEFKQWGSAVTITGTREFFNGCKYMTYTATDAPNFNQTVTTTYRGGYRFFYNCDSITHLDISNWDVSSFQGNTASSMFESMNNCELLNISNWNLSSISGSFANSFAGLGYSSPNGCEIIAPNLKIPNITTLNRMFYNASLSSVNLNNWVFSTSTSSVSFNEAFRRIGYNNSAFYGTLDLDLSTWPVSTNIASSAKNMFLESRGLKSINITNWDIRHWTNFDGMFSGCTYLEYIEGLSTQRWDSATSLSATFSTTYKLKFDIHDFSNDFGSLWNCTTFSRCFYRCGYNNALGNRGVFPNVTNWDMSNAVSVNQMLRDSRWNGTSTFAPVWDLSLLTGGALRLFAYNHVGIQTWDWTNVTFTSSITNFDSFATYVNSGSSPRALTSIKFGPNCNFSGISSFVSCFISRNACTVLEFDNSVSFATAVSFANFLTSVPLATSYYDNFLVRLDATNTKTGVPVSAQLCQYTLGSAAETSRTQLVTGQSWTITDAGGV